MQKTKKLGGACVGILLGLLIDLTLKTIYGSIVRTDIQINSTEETAWLKDWHNHKEIMAAFNRVGLGEVGKPANFMEYHKELYNKYGFDALLSDAISLNRSVADVRHKSCWNISYIAELPLTTVIIIFYNERLSVLLRTIYSILNRTPAKLLQEIILVDDGSTWPDMLQELEQSLQLHFADKAEKVKLIRQGGRTGLMAARMTGAYQASKATRALVFLDSHFEVGYNWLPPLLEPIAINPKTCTCPIIDRIAYDTFQYKPETPWRGYFDYKMNYHMMSLKPEEKKQPAKNFKNYVMMGGAMAIGSDFFWQLGGFDEGMTHWGGEQFEMSFKIWMCGGQLLDVPCSRMGHLFRDYHTQGNKLLYGDYSFCKRNYRRILDVWVEEEHRKYFFEQRPELKTIDAGDLSAPSVVRERLQCKNFTWMLENVMPDMHDHFLPVEPKSLATGLIRSVQHSNFCLARANDSMVILEPCAAAVDNIEAQKNWLYNWRGELRILGGRCMEPYYMDFSKVNTHNCHNSYGNQKWYYDYQKQWIVKLDKKLCIRANIEEQRVQLTNCDNEDLNLKWTFSQMSQSEMEKFDKKLKS